METVNVGNIPVLFLQLGIIITRDGKAEKILDLNGIVVSYTAFNACNAALLHVF